MPTRTLHLYEFRYRDARTGKWTKARYRATLEEMASRYAEAEAIGEPEVRLVDPDAGYFNPYRSSGQQ